jgi:hypothetical protein
MLFGKPFSKLWFQSLQGSGQKFLLAQCILRSGRFIVHQKPYKTQGQNIKIDVCIPDPCKIN